MHLDELFSVTEDISKTRKAVFVMGPPGAGKNTIIDKFFSHSDFKIDDFDEVMQRHKLLKNKEDTDYKHGYNLANKRRNIWIQNKLNLVINTTGRREDNVRELKEMLEKEGYKTFCVFVKTPYDIAANRIQQRSQQATDIANKGRKVELSYFDQAYIKSVANIKFFKLLFGDLNFAIIINDLENSYYEASLFNFKRMLSRFLSSKN